MANDNVEFRLDIIEWRYHPSFAPNGQNPRSYPKRNAIWTKYARVVGIRVIQIENQGENRQHS